jgi:hypothetical protein
MRRTANHRLGDMSLRAQCWNVPLRVRGYLLTGCPDDFLGPGGPVKLRPEKLSDWEPFHYQAPENPHLSSKFPGR